MGKKNRPRPRYEKTFGHFKFNDKNNTEWISIFAKLACFLTQLLGWQLKKAKGPWALSYWEEKESCLCCLEF